MATNYPGSLDSWSNPGSSTGMNDPSFYHDVVHDNVNDAVIAIETELGANPSGQASTVAARLANFLPFNVVDYGATGNGSTEDTTAVQAAIDAANSAGGGIVWFPKGTYLCAGLLLYANIGFRGVGITSVLKKKYDAGNSSLLNVDSNSASAFIAGMSFQDMCFRGTIDSDTTFNQYGHLMYLNGVTDLTIQNCDFIGWHGDAIYLGSGDTPGTTERHNKRVKIIGNRFDGITKNNRNCISVIDGEDVLILGNSSMRHTRSDMPGFVDCEPNGSSTFAVIRNIRVIGNNTYDHCGNLFQLMLNPSSFTTEPGSILVAHNMMDGNNSSNTCLAFLSHNRNPTTDTSIRDNIKIIGNIAKNITNPFYLQGGLAGVDIIDNTFVNSYGCARVGEYGTGTVHVRIERNTFREINNSSQSDSNCTLLMQTVSRCQIIGNTFDNCGYSGGGGDLLYFNKAAATPVTNYIDFLDNIILGTRATGISRIGTGTTTAANNMKRGYRNNGLAWNQNGTVFSGTPDA